MGNRETTKRADRPTTRQQVLPGTASKEGVGNHHEAPKPRKTIAERTYQYWRSLTGPVTSNEQVWLHIYARTSRREGLGFTCLNTQDKLRGPRPIPWFEPRRGGPSPSPGQTERPGVEGSCTHTHHSPACTYTHTQTNTATHTHTPTHTHTHNTNQPTHTHTHTHT